MRKGFVLVASLFIVVFIGIFISIGFLSGMTQLNLVESERASMYAFYAAEAGLERVIFELRRDISWGLGIPAGNFIDGCPEMPGSLCQDVPIRLNPADVTTTRGTYSILSGGVRDTITDAPWILIPFTIDGSSFDAENNLTRTVDAQIRAQSPVAFSFFTLGDLAIGGGATINNSGSDIFARDINFEVTAPESVTINGNAIYLRNITGYPSPEVTITGSVTKDDPITFAGVDTSYYDTLATIGGLKVSGNFSYSGDISPTDLGAPNGVIYVDGDASIEGTVIAPVIIVSSGDIHITGDIDYAASSPNAQIGLFSDSDIIIDATADGGDGDVAISALLIADNGMVRAKGSAASKNQLDFTGAILTRGKFGERTAISLNTYKTRIYNDDPALFSNPQLPFMMFLVNLRVWTERDLPAIQAVQ